MFELRVEDPEGLNRDGGVEEAGDREAAGGA